MWTKLKTNFLARVENFSKTERPYIVPTLDGLKLFSLNFILLIIGLVYANNYVLLFNFILFCLFLSSMYYTHFNLHGLKLTSANLPAFHAGEEGVLSLTFQSRSGLGHHFLGLRISKSLVSTLVVSSVDESFSFSVPKSDHSNLIQIPVVASKRGHGHDLKIVIETYFPFHLFRCFMYYSFPLNIIVYPEKKALHLHQTKILTTQRVEDGDEFILKDFKLGDSPKRVFWKKLAQTNRWYTKYLVTPKAEPVLLGFSKKELTSIEREEELSSITSDLYFLQAHQANYGLLLNDHIFINPDNSFYHFQNCLRALAEYEN